MDHIALDEPISTSKCIGSGSYGNVYEVKYKENKYVAKKLHEILRNYDQHLMSDSLFSKFLRECTLLSQMNHPNVVKFIGISRLSNDHTDIVLVMERLHIDLDQFIEQHKSSLAPSPLLTNSNDIYLPIKLGIIHNIICGLLHIHSHQVIHRDLNAGNILLTKDFKAKVADLGVARSLPAVRRPDSSSRLTKVPGCPDYMPPEALSDNPKYGKPLDVFSLGHLMLYLVSCRYPSLYEPTIDELNGSLKKSGVRLSLQAIKRKASLDLISDDHCTIKSIVGCLSDKPEDRPNLEKLEKDFAKLSSDFPKLVDSVLSLTDADDHLSIRIKACMILAGVGDALGYKNGLYELKKDSGVINQEVQEMGGVSNITISPLNWMVSDGTIMHIATAEALVSNWENDHEKLYLKLAEKYKECMNNMSGRAPGNTCMSLTCQLRPTVPKGYVIPFNPRGGGCGAATRAVPIGLYFNCPDQLNELVAVSIENGRMTHNHPTGYLGALAVALFVSYAFQKKPLVEWGAGLIKTLDIAWEYIKKEGRDVEENKKHWTYFKDQWMGYLSLRGIEDGRSLPNFPIPYDAKARDSFYKQISFSGWGGSSGHDAPMIAYDALLGCGESWSELCSRGMFHGGDSDGTGLIAAACWGAMKGFEGVPECNYQHLEYRDRLEKLAQLIK